MTQPGGRDSGGNSSVVATPSQAGATAGTFTGGPVTGKAVVATGTGSGTAVDATGGTTGIGVNATGTGGVAVVATNAGTVEALKVIGDTASTTAAMATMFLSPLQNQPSGTHAIGHMYVTAAGKLMICTSAGTPGTFTIVGTQS